MRTKTIDSKKIFANISLKYWNKNIKEFKSTFASKSKLMKGMVEIINREISPTILMSLVADGCSTIPMFSVYQTREKNSSRNEIIFYSLKNNSLSFFRNKFLSFEFSNLENEISFLTNTYNTKCNHNSICEEIENTKHSASLWS